MCLENIVSCVFCNLFLKKKSGCPQSPFVMLILFIRSTPEARFHFFSCFFNSPDFSLLQRLKEKVTFRVLVKWKEIEAWCRQKWSPTSALLPPNPVTLGKSPQLSEPQFLHMQNGVTNNSLGYRED